MPRILQSVPRRRLVACLPPPVLLTGAPHIVFRAHFNDGEALGYEIRGKRRRQIVHVTRAIKPQRHTLHRADRLPQHENFHTPALTSAVVRGRLGEAGELMLAESETGD